ncbi:hypothetical protein OS11_13720 [Dickeya oryzae]
MEAWLEHLITQSLAYSLTAVLLVAFLESLALVGLLLPGTIMMASLGTLIGSGNMGLYPAWGMGIIGCLLGDWISYFIGWHFNEKLHNWSFLQKHRAYLYRTEKNAAPAQYGDDSDWPVFWPDPAADPDGSGDVAAIAPAFCTAEYHRLSYLASGVSAARYSGRCGD